LQSFNLGVTATWSHRDDRFEVLSAWAIEPTQPLNTSQGK
jgi:hypothetical protein